MVVTNDLLHGHIIVSAFVQYSVFIYAVQKGTGLWTEHPHAPAPSHMPAASPGPTSAPVSPSLLQENQASRYPRTSRLGWERPSKLSCHFPCKFYSFESTGVSGATKAAAPAHTQSDSGPSQAPVAATPEQPDRLPEPGHGHQGGRRLVLVWSEEGPRPRRQRLSTWRWRAGRRGEVSKSQAHMPQGTQRKLPKNISIKRGPRFDCERQGQGGLMPLSGLILSFQKGHPKQTSKTHQK